ncbi:MAG TPA: hypothetical protein VFH58_12865 [Acidimicrobiales bacterium]|nr:hypothetical protein [Acidimicrobiales bacterium]
MHPDDESWSEWAADAPRSSTDPSAGPDLEVGGAPGAEFEQDLMAFLSDFRAALQGDVGPAQAAVADDAATLALLEIRGAGTGARHGGAEPQSSWQGDPYMGSETQVEPGWWMASDRRWYPPELHPDHVPDPAPPRDEAAPSMPSEVSPVGLPPDLSDRKTRFAVARPRLKRFGQSPATA